MSSLSVIDCTLSSSVGRDEDAGAVSIRTTERGVPKFAHVSCPCGCGQTKHLLLEPFEVEGVKTWHYCINNGAANLYPDITFERQDGSGLEHWRGWFLEGEWIKAESFGLQLAN